MSQGNPTNHEIDVYCAEWILNGGDQSKAWRKAYPKSTAPEKVSWEKGSVMNKMKKVQKRLNEMQAEQRDKDEQEFDLSVSKIKEYLHEVVTAGLEITADGKRGGISAVTGALAEINKMNGNHAASKQEITGKDGTPLPQAVTINVVKP